MKSIVCLLVLAVLFSCGNSQRKEAKTDDIKKPLLSIIQKHDPYTTIDPSFQEEVNDWKEYNALKEFISKFTNISPNEALSNALELRDLVKNLQDSIKPVILENPAFNSRVNVLYNEALRLADMTYIPAIKAEEVNREIDKVLSSFSSMNSKINTVFSQKRFEDAIDVEDLFIGLDTTKIDSVSLKSIKTIEEEEEETEKEERPEKPKKTLKKGNRLKSKKPLKRT